jgi:hypothetical protein
MLEIEVVAGSSHSIRKMMMTKTKKMGKRRPDCTTSGDVATAESSSTMALTANQTHEAECREQTEIQTCQERPIDDFKMAIRELAYSRWEAAGFPAGDGFDFWLEAEREVKANQAVSTPAPE